MNNVFGSLGATVGQGISVCVVEDDDDLREELVLGLEDFGFSARGFSCSREFYRGLLQGACDIVVLDLGLPDEDGLSVAAYLEANSEAGIVILTGRRGISDRVRGLMAVADVYLVKPVDIQELAATLISVRRRVGGRPASATAATWALAQDGWQLMAPGGRTVVLTPSERIFLQYLFAQANTPVSRETLVTALGHRADYYFDHRLDMVVSRLRRKVRSELGLSLPLRTVRGVGFLLSATPIP